jgi:quercetin dioxygenase-like cupin family protein
MRLWASVAVAGVLVTIAPARPAADDPHKMHILQNESEIHWVDGPPFLPPGAQMAVVHGDPRGKEMYAVRAKLPANYKIPAHSHPGDEHVVVLSGSVYMGKGDKLDPDGGKQLKVGGFALMPAKMNHYAYTKEEATLLVYGIGPMDITYVNPADDPRKK